MKPLLKLVLLCIISSFLFTACSNKFSVTKRHYTKGHYIAHSNSKHVKTNFGKKNSLSPPLTYSKKVIAPSKQLSSPGLESKQAPLTSNVQTLSSKPLRDKGVQTQKNKAIFGNSTSENLITPLKDLHKAYLSKQNDHAHDHGHLSLFWIIILVILLLWFFGYIAGWGTGGLINLLLLIALILFILWLLRIL
jgi:hypothetical protein